MHRPRYHCRVPIHPANVFPPVWVGLFFLFTFTGSVVHPPDVALTVLGVLGLLYAWRFDGPGWRAMWREHRAIFISAAALALAIVWSQAMSARRGLPQSDVIPSQAAVLLCLPSLARFLMDERVLRGVVLLFAAFTAWHFIMLPIEAVTGWKLTWHEVHLLPRPTWPLNYQASGLAWQTFSFVGLFLPLFYLAWGPVARGRVFAQAPLPRWLMLALPLLWVVPVACVQSRSGFAGALLAAVLALALAGGRRLTRRDWLVVGGIALAAAWLYARYLTVAKSGADWRLAFVKAYFQASLDPQWLATGRGFSREAPPPLEIPGQQTLVHSHNDLAQVFFSWGLPGLVTYLAFWFVLLRLVWRKFASQGEWWPVLALVAFVPCLVTDVGLHFFEKAAFLVILLAMCMALPAAPPAPSIRPNPPS
jgi:hypothetical protein